MAKNLDLKIIFFGTPRFGAHVLDELDAAHLTPTVIVTAPDKARGRGLEVSAPEVKKWAQEHNVDVLQPHKLDADFMSELSNTQWHLFIVASYGKLLPKELLELPKHGTLNVHPSLLPRHRGASPIQRAILEDESTGVTIMLLDEEMDHGPIVAQASVEVEEWPPRASILSPLLAQEGGRLLAEVIPDWVRGDITPEEQEHSQATYTEKITKADGLIDLGDDPQENYRKIRAFDEIPGTYFFVTKKGSPLRVKIIDAEYAEGVLRLTRVLPEGKKEMDYEDFLRGNR